MNGTIYPKGALLLRVEAGSATNIAGDKFEMAYTMTGTPLIKSEKTGKTWGISWQQLLKMAVAEGVNDE